jgi:hypothetical protein
MADRRRRLTGALLLVAATLIVASVASAADEPDNPPAASAPQPAGAPEPSAPVTPTPVPSAPEANPLATQGETPQPAAPPGEPEAPPPQPDAAPGEPAAPAPPSEVKPAPPPEAPKDVVQPPKNLEPIPKETAISVLGRKVLGPDNENMGRVVDLLLDRDAHIQAVVIDFGGFLGVGSRKIAIDWRLVRFVPDNPDAPIALSLGKAEVQAAPEYKDSATQPPVMVGPPPSGPDAAR